MLIALFSPLVSYAAENYEVTINYKYEKIFKYNGKTVTINAYNSSVVITVDATNREFARQKAKNEFHRRYPNTSESIRKRIYDYDPNDGTMVTGTESTTYTVTSSEVVNRWR